MAASVRKRAYSLDKLPTLLGLSGQVVMIPSIFNPVNKTLTIDSEIQEKIAQLVRSFSPHERSDCGVDSVLWSMGLLCRWVRTRKARPPIT